MNSYHEHDSPDSAVAYIRQLNVGQQLLWICHALYDLHTRVTRIEKAKSDEQQPTTTPATQQAKQAWKR